MSSQVTRTISAVLHQEGQPLQISHVDLSIGQSWEEVVMRFDNRVVGGDKLVWRLNRHHLHLAIDEQPGSSTTKFGIFILTFGPHDEQYGWTHISSLEGPYGVYIWTQTMSEFLAASSYSHL